MAGRDDPGPSTPVGRLVVGADGRVTCRVPARVGLVGNPSDGYGGAVLATVLPVFAAEVTAVAATTLTIEGPGVTASWPSLPAWRAWVREHGHDDAQRIIGAALAVVDDHLGVAGTAARGGLHLNWTTTVPRSVGLAGSSALAVATIDAVATVWGASLDRRVVAALALSAERDVLGIAAGWQDRIVQAVGRAVLVDTAVSDQVDGVEVPRVAPLTWPSGHHDPPELLVAWSDDTSASSHDYHAPLRRSAEALAAPMAELGALARHAADAWQRGDAGALGSAMDAGWGVRQAHAPLRPDHTELVELVRRQGLHATTPGSGGAVVALCTDRQALQRARRALAAVGRPSLCFVAG